MTPEAIAAGLSKAQREAVKFLARTILHGLRPGDNLWPDTIVQTPAGEIEGAEFDALHRLGLADAKPSVASALIGAHWESEIGNVVAEWDWTLTPLGLAVHAAVRAIIMKEAEHEQG